MSLQHTSPYTEAIERLYRLEFTGMKLGLENIRALMEALGNPHRTLTTIHVAGTNGKGSVCNMLAAALQANGYKTGLFTSPHLVNYTERMKINGDEILQDRFVTYFQELWPEVERIQATFFETTTAIAFQYFRDEQVDVAVIETGLGGRLDATNVLEKPQATVITSIGLEHTEILGDTLPQIALEKAGIFKNGVPAIVNAPASTHDVFAAKAREVGAPLFFVHKKATAPRNFPLVGIHQLDNLATVEETLSHLTLPLDPKKSTEGITQMLSLTGLRARLESYTYLPGVKKGINLVLDVAHNPDGLDRLKEYFFRQGILPIVVAGFAKDKDVTRSLDVIQSFASRFIAVGARSPRAMSAETLLEHAIHTKMDARAALSVVDGVEQAIELAKRGETILLTGSHYVVGEFLENTQKR